MSSRSPLTTTTNSSFFASLMVQLPSCRANSPACALSLRKAANWRCQGLLRLAIFSRSRDHWSIMAKLKDAGVGTIERSVRLMADVMKGKTHDRRSAAAVPGVKVGRRGRFQTYRFDRSTILEPPTVADAIAACFGASLAPLFRGTSYEAGMANARNLVL